MNNALISPNELIYSQDNTLIGERIAEVSQSPFEIAEPLYWLQCADEVNANNWYFQTQTGLCQLLPLLASATINEYDTKLALIIAERNLRLNASDWTQVADVMSSHTIEWLTSWNVYRQALRDLPATITTTNIDAVIYPIPPQ